MMAMPSEGHFPPSLYERVYRAVEEAERLTSAEIRVHIEDECHEEVMDRAAYIFAELGMHRTERRNGVLVYVAVDHRKLAILGDVGISSKVSHDFWCSTRDYMVQSFSAGRYEEGLCYAIDQAALKLSEFFPPADGDKNELSNVLSTRRRKYP